MDLNLNWTDVDSSNLDAVAHDNKTNDLFVRFKNGSTYAYRGVSDVQHLEMIGSASVGKYLNANIKPYYPYDLI